MAKDLTPEETAELLENPNVLSVINGKVRFTKEFKELAYQGLENGTPMRQIFEENGIDPEILGMGRIYIFTYRIRKNAERSQGHTDLRVHNRHKPAKIAKGQTLESKVNQLEHELAYTQQEVEFLKKFIWQIWRRGNNGNPSTTKSKIRINTRSCFAGGQSP